jgi:hypothetical protein
MIRKSFQSILVVGIVAACGQSPDQKAAPKQRDKEAENTKAQVTPNPSSPKLSWFGEALTEEGAKALSRIFEAKDSVETELLAAWVAWHILGPPGVEAEQTGQPFDNIFLVRPGKATGESNSRLLQEADTAFLRFTRVRAPIERPLAILTKAWRANGKQMYSEQVLVYGIDGKWTPLKSNEQRLQNKGDASNAGPPGG